jgi:hypothetical protein
MFVIYIWWGWITAQLHGAIFTSKEVYQLEVVSATLSAPVLPDGLQF